MKLVVDIIDAAAGKEIAVLSADTEDDAMLVSALKLLYTYLSGFKRTVKITVVLEDEEDE